VRAVRGFLRFWWEFVIGDDWRIAAGVAAVLAGAAVLVSQTDASHALVAVAAAVGVALVAVGAIVSSAR
jgi:uncharacterized membrane protein HdeD (DUF308 family)